MPNNKPIVLHVTAKIFDLLKNGQKTCEFRPQTRYYMQRLEKARDYLALCHSGPYGYMNGGLFIDFRKAYLPKESHGSWFYSKVRDISLVRFDSIDPMNKELIKQVYGKQFAFKLRLPFNDVLWYKIELEV